MLSDKRLVFALAASVLLNGGGVAMVGSAALSQHHLPRPKPQSAARSAASLHPAPLQMAAASQEKAGSGDQSDGSADESAAASRQPGSDASQDEQAGKPAAKSDYKLDYKLSQKEAAALKTEMPLEQRFNLSKPLSRAQKQTLLQAQQILISSAIRAISRSEAKQGRNQVAAQQERSQAASSRTPTLNGKKSALSGEKMIAANHRSTSSSKMTVVTKPSVPGRNSHAGAPGSSIAPKLVKYPKMKLNLGTIHMTRPTRGITGGGSSDMREVEIKVHYVVDDPKNVPKTFKPDRIIKMFAANCNGDPGNTARCLPTGGNTRLGGGTLHGKHDRISGVKYCVPGGGGIPGGAGSQSQSAQTASQSHQGRLGNDGKGPQNSQKEYGRQAGSSRIISDPSLVSQPSRGGGSPAQIGGWHAGHLNPNEVMAQAVHPLHLPSGPSGFRGLVPGAEVPVPDRKWVSSPKSHLASALPGVQAVPLPRFTVSPRSIGSMSRFGTISWGKPVKIRHKKQPYGGDGSGLLGTYYRGNNFQTLFMTRPDRNIDFNWSTDPPDPRLSRTEEYSVRWEGALVPKQTDTYTLITGSDDGTRVYLDNRLIISDWTVHGPSEDAAQVVLVAGHKYNIKVEYYENGYGIAAMKLYWESPKVPREYVPEQCLRYPLAAASPR